jgi:phosphatidate cytidylyltransferase
MRRLISALVLIAIVVVVVWGLPAWAMVAAAAVVAALAGGELAAMGARIDVRVPVVFVAFASAAVAVAFVLALRHGSTLLDPDALGALLLALVVAAGVMTLAQGTPGPSAFARAAQLLMAPINVGAPLGALARVQWLFGAAATTWLIVTIAASDSAQYYTGRLLGRHKLAPTVSPAKTIEGACGGLVAAALSGLIIGPHVMPFLSPTRALAFAVLAAAFGMIGDLFESLLKRSAGVKDSSALIPGHGGVLDRIDSYLFAAPVFYWLLRYFA